jgi:hypothetical protein
MTRLKNLSEKQNMSIEAWKVLSASKGDGQKNKIILFKMEESRLL